MSGARSHGRLSIRASAQPRDLMEERTRPGVWTARVITLFPEAFPGPLGLSLTGKALATARLFRFRSGRLIFKEFSGTMVINVRVISGSDPGAVPGGSTNSLSFAGRGAEIGSTDV